MSRRIDLSFGVAKLDISSDAGSGSQGEQMGADDREHRQKDELDRTLGLGDALSIGVGTMLGAGVFVFPGLAAGQAGLSFTVSFAIGAVVALLVALPASELATAMPRSGGAYYFVSRGLGALPGAVAGAGLWVGLIFASAFYLVGFGHYFLGGLAELGLDPAVSIIAIALPAAVALTWVNIRGTGSAGDLQSFVVMLLVLMLGAIVLYGGWSLTAGRTGLPEAFAPSGIGGILRTAALVFTSYLGFVQIASVGGEIKKPDRNIPVAIVGSVLAVGTVYVLVMLVSTSVLPRERLAELGETAFVAVARSLLGKAGAVAVLAAGLLATLSSANASIMGSSRSAYALSRDELLPEYLRRVNHRWGTPHVSLLATGIPIAALTLLGRVEVLAQVASFLHLVVYGLLCVGLVVLRSSPPDWYRPSFRLPGHPVVPLLGAAASFGLLALMEPRAGVLSAAVVVAALLWHFLYAREVRLQGEQIQ